MTYQEQIKAIEDYMDASLGVNGEITRKAEEAVKEMKAASGDFISRQAAIDALDQIFDRCEEIEAHLPEGDPDRTGYKMYPDYMTVWKYLHQLPSAQPEQQWIPVTERLPEESGSYFVSGKWESGKVTVGDCEYDKDDGYFQTAWNFDVEAWMTLPEPYKGGEKDG